MESCPDPWVMQSHTPGDNSWYLYCTNQKFHDGGQLHMMAISRSEDFVHWNYVGDAFSHLPPGAAPRAGLWAPDVVFHNGVYYLYFVVSDTSSSGGSAIYVATSNSPVGPWHTAASPTVEPEPATCCGGQPRSTLDPEVVEDNGHRYLFFGGYYGGMFARELSADGLSTIPSSEVQIALDNRYEGSYVVNRNGYFYLMVSAGHCCAGALSGYGVFVARSTSVLGPYVDRDGHSLMEPRIGGTPVIATNGNEWIGPGHNAMFTDANGQDWMVYHAISASKPTFSDGETRRPVLMDPIDWINGWPVVRGGSGPSSTPQPAPAIVASTPPTSPPVAAQAVQQDAPGNMMTAFSDEFNGASLATQWQWRGTTVIPAWSLRGGELWFPSQDGDIYEGRDDVEMLTEPAPNGDFMIEVNLATDTPLSGVFNYVQGGFMLYKDTDNFVKLVSGAIGSTRQIQFAKQVRTQTGTKPLYGDTLLSAPGDMTWLRLVRRTVDGLELYTAYSSQDGLSWERGGTWTHTLGSNTRIGLVSMGGAGFNTQFNYIHVYSLAN